PAHRKAAGRRARAGVARPAGPRGDVSAPARVASTDEGSGAGAAYAVEGWHAVAYDAAPGALAARRATTPAAVHIGLVAGLAWVAAIPGAPRIGVTAEAVAAAPARAVARLVAADAGLAFHDAVGPAAVGSGLVAVLRAVHASIDGAAHTTRSA